MNVLILGHPVHHVYYVGIICALATEKAALEAMLDEEYSRFETAAPDENNYSFGRFGVHNVVIACLPAGVIGKVAASAAASVMRYSFPTIKIGLLVGIGGGVPDQERDVRLGDVIVSQPGGQHGGVVQWDFGKREEGGKFRRTGTMNKPPRLLLNALQTMQSNNEQSEPMMHTHLSKMLEKHPRMANRYSHQGRDNDQLFEATYGHVGGNTCGPCDPACLVKRQKEREDDRPLVHYGNIASGDEVIKDAQTRDQIAKDEGIICFEMEAAGLMDIFPCVVIRGVCDYSDSHKNKRWQPYAAATAAAYAKELLGVIDRQGVDELGGESSIVPSAADLKILSAVVGMANVTSTIRGMVKENALTFRASDIQGMLEGLPENSPWDIGIYLTFLFQYGKGPVRICIARGDHAKTYTITSDTDEFPTVQPSRWNPITWSISAIVYGSKLITNSRVLHELEQRVRTSSNNGKGARWLGNINDKFVGEDPWLDRHKTAIVFYQAQEGGPMYNTMGVNDAPIEGCLTDKLSADEVDLRAKGIHWCDDSFQMKCIRVSSRGFTFNMKPGRQAPILSFANGVVFVLQSDGNFCVYNGKGHCLFASGTTGRSPASLQWERNKLCTYDTSGTMYWEQRAGTDDEGEIIFSDHYPWIEMGNYDSHGVWIKRWTC